MDIQYNKTLLFVLKGRITELEYELSGSDLYAARFGEAITNLGDLDTDGFEGWFLLILLLCYMDSLFCLYKEKSTVSTKLISSE